MFIGGAALPERRCRSAVCAGLGRHLSGARPDADIVDTAGRLLKVV